MPQRKQLAAFEEHALTWIIGEGFASLDEMTNCDPPMDSDALCPCTVAYISNAIHYATTYKNSRTHRNGPSVIAVIESTEVPPFLSHLISDPERARGQVRKDRTTKSAKAAVTDVR